MTDDITIRRRLRGTPLGNSTDPVIRRSVRGGQVEIASYPAPVFRRAMRGLTPIPHAPIVPRPITRSTSGAPEREIQVPFSFGIGGGVTTTTNPDTQVRQQVEALLRTNPGERAMRPTYGVSLIDYVFENISDAELAEMQTRISNGFNTWIPTARLVTLSGVTGTNGVPLDTVIISLQYARRFDANPSLTSVDIPVVTA